MKSPSGVRCKRTSISRLVVKLHSQYRYLLVRRTACAYSPAVDGSVLIVAVRKCIVVYGSISAPRPVLGVGSPSVLCCLLGAYRPNIPCVLCRFWRLSFLIVPCLGRTFELCQELRVSFMDLGPGS